MTDIVVARGEKRMLSVADDRAKGVILAKIDLEKKVAGLSKTTAIVADAMIGSIDPEHRPAATSKVGGWVGG